MLPSSFRPDGTYDLVRLGKDHDGGYLVEAHSLRAAAQLLTFGLGDDWSFEKDFLRRNPVPLASYDHTLTEGYLLRKSLKYFLKMLIARKSLFSVLKSLWKLIDYKRFFRGDAVHHRLKVGFDGGSSRSLRGILEAGRPDSPIFLKADIEDGEYRILDDLLEHADRFCGFVVEFHDVDLHRERIDAFIQKFPLTLVHVHGNNCGGVCANGDPLAIEMVFAASPQKISQEPQIPHPLDQPNNKGQKELDLKFQPTQI